MSHDEPEECKEQEGTRRRKKRDLPNSEEDEEDEEFFVNLRQTTTQLNDEHIKEWINQHTMYNHKERT